MLAIKIIAVVAFIAKETGSSSVIAVFAPKPGMAPKMMPIITPPTKNAKFVGVKRLCRTSKTI